MQRAQKEAGERAAATAHDDERTPMRWGG
jgi:hypothetical protein